jgi:hypothetical protein
MRIIQRFKLVWFCVLCLTIVMGLGAQTTALSAAVTVLGDGVTLLRAGAVNPLSLRVGSTAPLGAGDQLTTGVDGRVLITFPEADGLYLLPDSRYMLTAFNRLDGERFQLEAELHGIAVQTFTSDPVDWDYALITPALTVTRPSEHFIVWAIPDRFETVISAMGVATVQTETRPEGVDVPAQSGVMPMYNPEAIPLEAPYHAVELLALAINCVGTVETGGSDGLRLRRGAALDYQVVGILYDDQAAHVVGITQNGRWYRIPYLTGFGWIYRELVVTTRDCTDLPVSPSLVGEANETVFSASELEIELLSPFYGPPRDNPLFYR